MIQAPGILMRKHKESGGREAFLVVGDGAALPQKAVRNPIRPWPVKGLHGLGSRRFWARFAQGSSQLIARRAIHKPAEKPYFAMAYHVLKLSAKTHTRI